MIETAVFTSAEGNGTRWRLKGMADAARWHGVALRFDVAGGQVVGGLVRWQSDEELPLQDVWFDGTRLSFRLPVVRALDGTAPAGKPPRLSLTLVGDREFRGHYVDDLDARLDAGHEVRMSRAEDDVISL